MKYTHKTKRIIAIILIMITCIVNAFSYTVYANETNDRVICNDLVDINDESIALTSLPPNTA